MIRMQVETLQSKKKSRIRLLTSLNKVKRMKAIPISLNIRDRKYQRLATARNPRKVVAGDHLYSTRSTRLVTQ